MVEWLEKRSFHMTHIDIYVCIYICMHIYKCIQLRRLWALATVRLLFSLIDYLLCLPVKFLPILGTEDLPLLSLYMLGLYLSWHHPYQFDIFCECVNVSGWELCSVKISCNFSHNIWHPRGAKRCPLNKWTHEFVGWVGFCQSRCSFCHLCNHV